MNKLFKIILEKNLKEHLNFTLKFMKKISNEELVKSSKGNWFKNKLFFYDSFINLNIYNF